MLRFIAATALLLASAAALSQSIDRGEFERGKDADPRVWLSYRAASSGSARLTLFVSNRTRKAAEED